MTQILFDMATLEQITLMINDKYFLSPLHIRPFLKNLIKPPPCLPLSHLVLLVVNNTHLENYYRV